jgi:hypothetical protein
METTMKALAVLTLTLASAVAAIAAPAGEVPTAVVDGDGRAPRPVVQVVGDVAYLNGGAGLGEAEYLKSRASEFPLQFLFSGQGGEYGVADKVTIRNADRELVSVRDAGPFLMLKVPPGRYTVEASFKGAVETRTVLVGNGVSKVNWNTPRVSD